MRTDERRRPAMEAALGVAGALRINVEQPRLLKDSNNTIVHLAPAPIVAKIGTSHFRDLKLESLERELAVATHLADRGAPAIRPTRDVPPGPHHWENMRLTLWQYAEPYPGAALDSPGMAAVLAAVHEGLMELQTGPSGQDETRRLLG